MEPTPCVTTSPRGGRASIPIATADLTLADQVGLFQQTQVFRHLSTPRSARRPQPRRHDEHRLTCARTNGKPVGISRDHPCFAQVYFAPRCRVQISRVLRDFAALGIFRLAGGRWRGVHGMVPRFVFSRLRVRTSNLSQREDLTAGQRRTARASCLRHITIHGTIRRSICAKAVCLVLHN